MVFFYFLDTLQGGGVERVCLDHARILASKRHRVFLIPLDGRVGLSIPENCSLVEHYNFKKPPAEEISRTLREYICSDSELAFVFHMRKSASYLAKNISYFGAKEVKSCQFIHADLTYSHGVGHGSPLKTLKLKHFWEFWRIPKILRKFKMRLEELRIIHAYCPLFVVSEAIKNQCTEFGLKGAIILNNGVDIQWIEKLAAEPLHNEPRPYFIHVARLSKEKRQDTLLRAFARSGSSLKLVILGDGPCRNALERLSRSLDIADRVDFLGFLDNPYPVIKNAEFSVICSEYEGFGLSIAESICLSVPVLMTDRPYGIRTLLNEYDPFYIVEDNEKELANRIRELSLNPIPFDAKRLIQQLSLDHAMVKFLNEMRDFQPTCQLTENEVHHITN